MCINEAVLTPLLEMRLRRLHRPRQGVVVTD
jgi:hypothetical protein